MTKTQDWVFFMTSPDMFGQDDSCWIWKEILLLDLERNSVTGFWRKFCFSDKRKRMKSLSWQNCLQNCCIISIFTFIVQKQDIWSLTKNEKKRRHISNKHNLKTNVPKSRITELNCSCKIDNLVTEDVANKVAIISYRRIAKTSQFYLQDHSVSRSWKSSFFL